MFKDDMAGRIMRIGPFFRKTPGGYVSPFDERGFEVGDGWLYLIHILAWEIYEILGDGPQKDDYQCEQIKQKHGRLAVYYKGPAGSVRDRIQGVIQKAEKEASITCELCRAPGKLTDSNGYSWVACPTHLSGRFQPLLPHTWEVKEVDGGSVGTADVYTCRSCGAGGGPTPFREPYSMVMTTFPPFLPGKPQHKISLDCAIAKRQIEEIGPCSD